MSNLTAKPVSARAPLDAAKQAADGLLSILSELACIVRSGAALPVGDGRERIARLLVCWAQNMLPDLESQLAALNVALGTIHNDVIEARGGEPFSLAWRKCDSAFDVLRQLVGDVAARFRDCPAAVESGSRVFCERLESAVPLTSDDIESLRDGINKEFALARQQSRLPTLNVVPQLPPVTTVSEARPKSVPRQKRSTEQGEGLTNLISTLSEYHQYADGGCLNTEPVGNNELARLAGVSESTASGFFKKQFKCHMKYRALCRDTGKLVAALKLLNGDFTPQILYGRRPADEDARDEE